MTTPLPTCPMPDDPAELEDVLGFGLDLNSHALYRIERKKTLFKLISSKTELKFSFRASNPNGIMLYTANEPSQTDFIECHLEGSKVACSFNAGGGTLKLITADATYSDGKWHTVWLSRQKVDGTLYVDGIEVDSGNASGSPTYINSLERFFLGGVPEKFDAKRVPAGSKNSFPGCITNVTVDDKKIDTPVTNLYKAQNCYRDSPESGVSFKNGGGYLKVADKYSVGQQQEISLEIKPTSHTGLLLSSWNAKGDYIVLEMSNGNIIFRAENGGGQLVAQHSVNDPLQFCDGEWHKIQVWKRNNVVKIQVDENPSYESEPLGAQTSADIYDPLYVGGLPPVGETAKGVTVTEGYTGCVRNLISKKPGGDPQTLYLANPLMMGGNLYLGGCPYK